MNKVPFGIFLFCWILLQPSKLLSQYFDEDASLWLKVELEKKVMDNLSLQLTTQCRINNNVSQIGQVALDFGLRYKINKHIKLMGDYVYRENRLLDGNYLSVHQFYTGFIFKQKFDRFTFRYRLRIQTRFKQDEIAADVIWPSTVLRNKFTLKYEINKLIETYVAYELGTPLYSPQATGFNRSRTYLGSAIHLSKQSAVEVYFMLQRAYSYKNQPQRDFVYGLNYIYNF